MFGEGKPTILGILIQLGLRDILQVLRSKDPPGLHHAARHGDLSTTEIHFLATWHDGVIGSSLNKDWYCYAPICTSSAVMMTGVRIDCTQMIEIFLNLMVMNDS